MRKKPFKSKWQANPLAYLRAVQAVSPLVKEQQIDLASYWLVFEAILGGHGVEDHFHTLAGTVNIAVVLSEAGYCADAKAAFLEAQDALMNCWRRFSKFGKIGFTGLEIGAMRRALVAHHVQMEITPQKAMLAAVHEVMKRKSEGHLLEMVPA